VVAGGVARLIGGWWWIDETAPFAGPFLLMDQLPASFCSLLPPLPPFFADARLRSTTVIPAKAGIHFDGDWALVSACALALCF
jgi:hypothetical protein